MIILPELIVNQAALKVAFASDEPGAGPGEA